MMDRCLVVSVLVAFAGCFDPTEQNNGQSDSTGTGASSSTDATSASTAPTSSPSSSDPSAPESGPVDSSSETSATISETSDDATVGTTSVPAGCGDGNVDPGEDCDDGDGVDGNGCNNDCLPSGRMLWCVLDGDTDEDVGNGVSADNLGNVYATGTLFREGVDEDVWVGSWAPDGTASYANLYDISSGGYDRGFDLVYYGSADDLFVVAATDGEPHLLRIGVDGTLENDSVLMVTGATSLEPTAIAVAPNGLYWTGTGSFGGSSEMVIGRLTSFIQPQWSVHAAHGPGTFPVLTGVTADPLDDVYVAGTSGAQGFLQHRTMGAGALDFDVGSLPPMRGIAVAGNGELVLVGTTFVNGQGDNVAVQRRSADGSSEVWSVDFNGAANLDDTAGGIVVDADDRIVVAGALVDAEGTSTGWIARLDGDGTTLWSTEFEPEPGFYSNVSDVVVAGDGASSIVGTHFGEAGDGDILVCHFAP